MTKRKDETPEDLNARRRAQHAADPEKNRAAWRTYYAKNSERIVAANTAGRDPENHRATEKARYWADPEKAKAKQNARRAADPEKYRARARSAHAENPERAMLHRASSRARELGVPFNLTIEDVAFPGFCPVLGIPLIVGTDGEWTDNSPALDRTIPSLGYVRGNVVVMSMRANNLKNNASPEEIALLAAHMLRVT